MTLGVMQIEAGLKLPVPVVENWTGTPPNAVASVLVTVARQSHAFPAGSVAGSQATLVWVGVVARAGWAPTASSSVAAAALARTASTGRRTTPVDPCLPATLSPFRRFGLAAAGR